MVLASSHLILVTSEAVIDGVREFTSVLVTRGAVIGGDSEFTLTKLPNSEQSYKGKVKTHNYINRQNQSTTGKL